MGAHPRTYATGQSLTPNLKGDVRNDRIGWEEDIHCAQDGAARFWRHWPVAARTGIDEPAFQNQR